MDDALLANKIEILRVRYQKEGSGADAPNRLRLRSMVHGRTDAAQTRILVQKGVEMILTPAELC